MSTLTARTHSPLLGPTTVHLRNDHFIRGRPLLASVQPQLRPHDARQARGHRTVGCANANANATALVSHARDDTAIQRPDTDKRKKRYGKHSWRISKKRSPPPRYVGNLDAMSDTIANATARVSSSQQHPHQDTVINGGGDLTEWYHEDDDEAVTWGSETIGKRHCLQPAPLPEPDLFISTSVPRLFLDSDQLFQPGSLVPSDQDTLSPQGSPQGTWAAGMRRQDPTSSGPTSPLAEHVLSLSPEWPRALWSLGEGQPEHGPYPFGSHWRGGGGGGQPSTTGTQGFQQYVTAGPDVSLFGHNLFGYEADDDLQGAIRWA